MDEKNKPLHRCVNCNRILGEFEFDNGYVKLRCPKCKTWNTWVLENKEPASETSKTNTDKGFKSSRA